MTNAQKLLVIVENGRIVGTQFGVPANGNVPAVSVGLQRGPGQEVHEIEMEPPASLRTLKNYHEFHEQVAEKLGIDRLYGRKG